MGIQVYNTLTNKKEPFTPIKAGKVSMYLCGPTVYDNGHLGHGRSAVAFDIIRRYLEYTYGNENVTFVTNYTDIDDKMIKRAKKEGITVKELAERIIPEYTKDYAALGVKPSTIQTLATEYVDEMIDIVKILVEKEFAYELDDGVYFEVEKFKEYGKLSNQNRDELRAGARIEKDDKKRHPHDFVLWKKEKPGEPSWDSPWGKGRPGWHIECSAMSQATLGQPFDIHGGGQDLTFPHHECEIAQSEAAYETQFCNIWLHNGFITVDEEKMSKSLGNFFTLKDIFKKYDPQAVRYFFLTAQYRSPIEFTETQLTQASSSLERIKDFLINVKNNDAKPTEKHNELNNKCKQLITAFESSMNDDFDTPAALAALFTFIKHINPELREGILSKEDSSQIMKTLQKVDTVLNILPAIDASIDQDVEKLIAERKQAREEGNWKRSDKIREELANKGIALEDTAQGTIWKKV